MTSLGSAQLRLSEPDSQTRNDDLAPPPPLPSFQLERTSSSPSSFSSSTILASPPLSPEEIRVDNLDQPQDIGDKLGVATATRQVRTSISMDGMTGNPAVFNRDAMRSRSGSNPAPIVMPRPAQRAPSQARPIINTTQSSRSARTDAPKSSGGFASFIRRLTGRSASPPKSKSKNDTATPSAASRPGRPVMPVTMERSASADASTASRAARSARPTLSIETPSTSSTSPSMTRPGPLTAPAAPQPGQILPGPTPLSPQQITMTPVAETQPRPTDPCEIPLPPSPLAAPLSLPSPNEPASELLLSPMTPMLPSALQAPTIRRTHPSGMLSLEGFEEESASDLTDEASESEDMVHDLKPIRIPSSGARSNTSSNSAVGPATPASVNSTYDEIVTPSSAHGASPDFHARYAGSSPPRKAPIGTGASTGDLGRKGSKWRKSVMGLSDHLGGKAVSRKQSTRVPPSSYDAYEAHQRRIANNRSSCAPTIHSTASIAAELREIKDKEESDRAETFFLS